MNTSLVPADYPKGKLKSHINYLTALFQQQRRAGQGTLIVLSRLDGAKQIDEVKNNHKGKKVLKLNKN